MNKLLNIALSQYGVKEIQGKNHNPVIVGYSKEIGYGGIVADETAWCSIFIELVCVKKQTCLVRENSMQGHG